jgi:hypothetical protein
VSGSTRPTVPTIPTKIGSAPRASVIGVEREGAVLAPDLAVAMARAGFGPTLEGRELRDALISAIADRRGCCSWKVRLQGANPAQIVVDNCHENCVGTVNGCVKTAQRRKSLLLRRIQLSACDERRPAHSRCHASAVHQPP